MTTVSRWLSLIAALAVMPIAACSSGDASDGDGATPQRTTVPSTTGSGTGPPTSTTASDGDDSPTDTSTTVAPPPDTDPATDDDVASDDAATTTIALIEGVDATIEPLTPVAGSGFRPLLEWLPVDGASHYMVVVYAPNGSPYWTWTGAATSVHVGGDPVLEDDRPGPSVVDGMTWGIVALDDEIVPIASSDRRPIAP